jgi:outer membrane protein insertion porin family
MRTINYARIIAGKLAVAICILALSSSLILVATPLDASDDIFVEKIVVDGLVSCSRHELLSLINVDYGLQARGVITDGIKRAFKKGIFEDITVEYSSDGTLYIKVKEHKYIEKIEIRGNSYINDKEIRKRFLFKEGEIFRSDLIYKAGEDLKNNLVLMGFPELTLSLEIKKSRKPYRVIIILNIKEGKPQRIGKIELIGYKDQIRERLGTKPGDIYNIENIRKDLEKLERFLRSRGYINPVVGPFTFSNGILRIFISPGKKLSIKIEGNTHIKTSEILKLLSLEDLSEIDRIMIEESSEKIVSLYRGKGFLNVKVTPVKKETDKEISLKFLVDEGRRFTVKGIEFRNITISENSLRAVTTLHKGSVYSKKDLDRDKGNIVDLYRGLGYLDAKIDDVSVDISEEDSTVFIRFGISEGKKFILKEVIVRGNTVFTDDEISDILNLRTGSPFNELEIIDSKRRLLSAYHSRGFINARVNLKSEISGNTVAVIYNIFEGDLALFGKTIVRGNRFTRTIVIERALNYKEGYPLNKKLLPETSKRLYQLGLFEDVNIKLQDGYDHKRDILIDVKEKKPGAVEFGIGYEDYEKYRGSIEVSYKNLWGMNRRITLRTAASTLKNRFLLSYGEPYLFGDPLQFNAVLLRDYRKEKNIDSGEILYKVERYSSEASVEKDITDNLTTQLSYNFSLVRTSEVKPDIVLSREDVGTLAISSFTPGLLFDNRDNPFDPTRGLLLGSSFKVASTLFLGETDFVKLNLHGSGYKSVHKGFVVALSVKGGFAKGFNRTNELPIVERYFLGGRNTVRGFAHNSLGPKGSDGTPTGGNAFLSTNIELRSSLGKGFGLVTFFDAGNVWTKIENIDLSFRYTAGLGLRYRTPVGPISIDYGHKLDRRSGESAGEIHFNIGHPF